jgi:S1-C subfamily serine protease
MYATSNILSRVVRIVCNNSMGTGTVIDYAGSVYLVTARHVLPDDEAKPLSIIHQSRTWNGVCPRLRGVDPRADVSVLRLPDDWSMSDLTIELSTAGVILSSDVMFLGFPYGYTMRVSEKDGWPFIKKATLSAHDNSEDLEVFYLDGINNPGFSGGPVFVSSTQGPPKLFSIVSGYIYKPMPIFAKGEEVPDAFVQMNTGIMITYSIRHALEALSQSGEE